MRGVLVRRGVRSRGRWRWRRLRIEVNRELSRTILGRNSPEGAVEHLPRVLARDVPQEQEEAAEAEHPYKRPMIFYV